MMSNADRLALDFVGTVPASVHDAVEAGEYTSVSEVLQDALTLWEERRRLQAKNLDYLRAAWADGMASGEPEPLDIEKIIGRARERLKTSRHG